MTLLDRTRTDPPTAPIPLRPERPRSSRRARTVGLVVAVVLLLALGVAAIVVGRTDPSPGDGSLGAPGPVAPVGAAAPPDFPTQDSSGRPLSAAVISGGRALTAALVAGDLRTLRTLYVPGSGAAKWSSISSRLNDPRVRDQLVAALRTTPERRPEVAYLFERDDRGVGMTAGGKVAFFGTGQDRSSPSPSSAGPSVAAGPSPTLGSVWASNQQGFGDARPSTVYAGGDPTGMVENITWSSWGGATATGRGTGYWYGPEQYVSDSVATSAVVIADQLGTCRGRPAYLRIRWYYPSKGETAPAAGDGFDQICTAS